MTNHPGRKPGSAPLRMTPQQLRDLRARAGLTQQRAADLAGVALRTMQQYEAGDRQMPLSASGLLCLSCILLGSPAGLLAPWLPISQMNVDVWDSEVRGLHGAGQPYFIADQRRAYARAAQRRAYARAAIEAEREACAKACDDRAAYYRGDDDGPDGRRTIACEACAGVIRWRPTGALPADPPPARPE